MNSGALQYENQHNLYGLFQSFQQFIQVYNEKKNTVCMLIQLQIIDKLVQQILWYDKINVNEVSKFRDDFRMTHPE